VSTATATPLARTRREQQRLETRELLFELALEEFRRVGTAKARIRDIVDAAGVVPGTFYFHFPTRDHVVFELWLRNSRRLVERLPPVYASPPPPVADTLRRLGEAMIDIEEETGDIALVRDSIAVVLRPPEGTDPAASGVGEVIVALLAGGLERGEIASELDPPGLASVLLTSILGVLIAAPDDAAERRRDLRRTIDFFLKALRPA
jgi:TetR/AcrR family transcriptional repressor of uid operon